MKAKFAAYCVAIAAIAMAQCQAQDPVTGLPDAVTVSPRAELENGREVTLPPGSALSRGSATEQAEATVKKMLSVWEAYNDAPSRERIDQMFEGYAEDLASNNDGELELGKNAFRRGWLEGYAKRRSWPSTISCVANGEILQAVEINRDTVIVHTRERLSFYSEGQTLQPFESVWTYVVAQRDGKWLIVSQAGSRKQPE